MSIQTDDAEKIIGDLGGNAKTAAFFEVTPGAVSQWLYNGIPKDKLKYLKLARPDLFPKTTKRRRSQVTPP